MDKFTESTIILINSKDAIKRNGTFNSDVVFNFRGIFKEQKYLYSHVQLITATIPVSFYNMNSNNNVLKYTISSIVYTITIPEGNYNFFSLATIMTSLFFANGHTITITITKSTGKIAFTGTTNFQFNFSGSSILKILGFLTTINYVSSSFLLNAPYPLNLMGTKRLTVISTSLSTTGITSLNTETQSILGTIQINQPAFGLVLYENSSSEDHVLKVKIINTFDIKIYDEEGLLVDFNNQDWLMKIKISSTSEYIPESSSTLYSLTTQDNIQRNKVPTPNLAKPTEPTNDELDILLHPK